MSSTMIFNAYYPFIEWGLAWGMPFAFRLLDNSFSCDSYKTKLTSMQMYVDLYSGPAYFIHFKYSSMLNVLFVTMLYGVGIPILFPIAAITYFIYYSLERLCVAYFFQMPPTFDDKMTKNAVKIMRWAAVMHLFFGYWMLSNK